VRIAGPARIIGQHFRAPELDWRSMQRFDAQSGAPEAGVAEHNNAPHPAISNRER
jgi:hypothetical protein